MPKLSTKAPTNTEPAPIIDVTIPQTESRAVLDLVALAAFKLTTMTFLYEEMHWAMRNGVEPPSILLLKEHNFRLASVYDSWLLRMPDSFRVAMSSWNSQTRVKGVRMSPDEAHIYKRHLRHVIHIDIDERNREAAITFDNLAVRQLFAYSHARFRF